MLGFDVRLTRVQPPSTLEAEAIGELEGTGRWALTSADGGTLVRYNWDIRTTRRWMNLLAPVARLRLARVERYCRNPAMTFRAAGSRILWLI